MGSANAGAERNALGFVVVLGLVVPFFGGPLGDESAVAKTGLDV